MARRVALATLASSLLKAADANGLVKAGGSVTVYDGPTECDDTNRAKIGDMLHMHYTGTIDASSKTGTPGAQFDSSRDRDHTLDFHVGTGQVIQGWDQGLLGLCKGAKATLVVPPDMGYGEQGAGDDIPGGATLNFDVEVVDITDDPDAPPPPNVFKDLDFDGDGKISLEEVKAHFDKQGAEMPDGLFEKEDKNGNGFIEWGEFSGPKGSAEEL